MSARSTHAGASCLLALALCCAFARAPHAQASASPSAARAHQPALERWRALDPAQRERIRERYGAWRALDPEQQRELGAKAQRTRRNFERELARLSPEQRASYDALAPAEQRALEREHARWNAPRRTPVAERAAPRWRERPVLAAPFAAGVARALRPSLADLLELRALEPAERRVQLRERARLRALAWIEQHALLGADELERLRALSAPELFRELRSRARHAPPSAAAPAPNAR